MLSETMMEIVTGSKERQNEMCSDGSRVGGGGEEGVRVAMEHAVTLRIYALQNETKNQVYTKWNSNASFLLCQQTYSFFM